MLTIILTIILFCILAAIYALYVGKIEGGVDPQDKVMIARLAKFTINYNTFITNILSSENIFDMQYVRKINGFNSNGTGCPCGDATDMWFEYDKSIKISYIFPEICMILMSDDKMFIVEPKAQQYATIDAAVNASLTPIIKEQLNIYQPLLQNSNNITKEIVDQVVNNYGFCLECDIWTTTDADFIDTMREEHYLLYVCYLLIRKRYDDAYSYIISLYENNITMENNISRDVHLLILQYLYRDIPMSNMFIYKKYKIPRINKDKMFYLATLFVVIANLTVKSKINYKYDVLNIRKYEDKCIVTDDEKAKSRLKVLQIGYMRRSMLVRFIMFIEKSIYSNIVENINNTLDVLNFDEIINYLITIMAEVEQEEDREYVIDKLKNEFANIQKEGVLIYNNLDIKDRFLIDSKKAIAVFYYFENTHDCFKYDIFNDIACDFECPYTYQDAVSFINSLHGDNPIYGKKLSSDKPDYSNKYTETLLKACDKFKGKPYYEIYKYCLMIRIFNMYKYSMFGIANMSGNIQDFLLKVDINAICKPTLDFLLANTSHINYDYACALHYFIELIIDINCYIDVKIEFDHVADTDLTTFNTQIFATQIILNLLDRNFTNFKSTVKTYHEYYKNAFKNASYHRIANHSLKYFNNSDPQFMSQVATSLLAK